VIVTTADLPAHAGSVTMVDGGFDPLHPGHVHYFSAAAELGLPVLCNVTSDDWVARKHRPLLSQAERGVLIDAVRWIAFVHLSSVPTAEVIRELRPRYYAKGVDWRGRLPADETRICRDVGTEVVFLDTVTHSSSDILERYERRDEG
jgi:bifunctional ADP-heptose synthase (sugar kinase/adenylyltransferase)